jgi:hypothetical protein
VSKRGALTPGSLQAMLERSPALRADVTRLNIVEALIDMQPSPATAGWRYAAQQR